MGGRAMGQVVGDGKQMALREGAAESVKEIVISVTFRAGASLKFLNDLFHKMLGFPC